MLPVTYALAGGAIVTAIDHKRKQVPAERLARVRWLRARPAGGADRRPLRRRLVAASAWVQAIGPVAILDAADAPEAIAALTERYEQYRERPPGRSGPVARRPSASSGGERKHEHRPLRARRRGAARRGAARSAAAAVAVRRRWLGDWTGALARLAEVVIGLALLIGILELLGAVGLFELGPIVIACALVPGAPACGV